MPAGADAFPPGRYSLYLADNNQNNSSRAVFSVAASLDVGFSGRAAVMWLCQVCSWQRGQSWFPGPTVASAFFPVKSGTSLRSHSQEESRQPQSRLMLCTIPVPAHTGAAHDPASQGWSAWHIWSARASPELELHPASPFSSLLIPVMLPLLLSPFSRLLSHHVRGLLLLPIGCESVVISI